MSKISARMIWFLIAVLNLGIGLAEVAIRGKLPEDNPLGLFALEISQSLGTPSPVVFAWYFSIAVCINVLFLACLWQLTRPSLRPLWLWLLLTLQLLMVLLYMSELSLVLTAELVVLLTWRQAWKCLSLLVGLCAFHEAYFLIRLGTPFSFALLGTTVFTSTVILVVPFIAGYLALREKRTRLQLLAVHRDLEANQALMMETIREEERLRVEAKLHDVIGHQITALKLNLDLALQHEQEKRSDEVLSALAISRESAGLLLSQVRTTTRDFI